MKRNILSLAVAATVAGGAVGTANAMSINDKGLGEVLVYPFYSAANNNDTYIHIVNTTNVMKAVKVRIVEGIDSQEVLDFNLYLSPEDMFAAVITEDPNGDGAIIRTRDTSCTVPALGEVGDGTVTDQPGGFKLRDQPFVDFLFGADDAVTGLERTAEGYIEVFEMGQWDPEDDSFGEAATHVVVADGPNTPADCGELVEAWTTGLAGGGEWLANNRDDALPWQGGGLYGYGVVINPENGTAAGYDAVAIDNYFDPTRISEYHRQPGDVAPNFQSANTTVDLINGNVVETLDFLGSQASADLDSLAAASALFMTLNISNDYVVDPDINALTDWIVTMPTKRDFTRPTGADPEVPAIPPFTNRWDGTTACEPVAIQTWDREESASETPPGTPVFSPRPQGPGPTPDFTLCTEVSVISFGDESAVSASGNILYGYGNNLDAIDGWARLSFDPALTNDSDDVRTLEDATGYTLFGLPVTGFAVLKYNNGDFDGNGTAANYAAAIEHKAVLSIETP